MLRPNAGWSGQAANALLSLHPACALKAIPSHAKRPYTRTEEADLTEMPADPGLNLEFVDEALSLVSDAEAKGIRLRILGSIAYRLTMLAEFAPVPGHQARSYRRRFRSREETKPRHPRIPRGARLRPGRRDLHGVGRRASRLSASADGPQRRRVRRRALSVIGFRSRAGSISTARPSARPTCCWRRCRSSRSI